MSELGAPHNARTDDQRSHMEETIGQGKCPFCEIDRTINPIDLLVGRFWRAQENAFPYPHHAYHLVLPTIDHITGIGELTKDSIEDWLKLVLQSVERFSILGGALVMREGDIENTAGTLRHLHTHIQSPNRMGPACVVFGRPNVSQIDETLQILQDPLFSRSHGWEREGKVPIFWDVDISKNPSPYVLQEFRFEARRPSTYKLASLQTEAIFELFSLWRELKVKYGLPGSSLTLKFGDPKYFDLRDNFITANIISARGNGPVIEVIKHALNKQQAENVTKVMVKK